VRNTIHIRHKGKDKAHTLTTVLHRWFEQARPFVKVFNSIDKTL
jgi:hypothetical protein